MLDFPQMSTSPRRVHYTYGDYLALEEESSVRHEFLDGEIYAMAGGSHFDAAVNEVGGQALAGDGGLLRPSLRSSPCQARMQQGQKQAQRSTT